MSDFLWDKGEVEKEDIPAVKDEGSRGEHEACPIHYLSYNPDCPSPDREEMEEILASPSLYDIYLDNNSTHPVLPSVVHAIKEAYQYQGNASSNHIAGRKSRAMVETVREKIAKITGFKHVIFTASGTEANNMIIQGVCEVVFVSNLEHKSVLRPAQNRIDQTFPMHDGFGFEQDLGLSLAIISMIGVNNETGIVYPVHKYANQVKALYKNVIVHSDMSQVLGKTTIEFDDLDAITLSGHKFGGPIGVGCLCLNDLDLVKPIIYGGSQEMGKRAGTYNMPLIVGFGEALEALREVDHDRIRKLRDKLESEVKSRFKAKINGDTHRRVINTSSIQFSYPATGLIDYLSRYGVYVSAGSACNAFSKEPSHVLKAMDLSDEEARATMRVSLSRFTTEDEIEIFLEVVGQYERLHV